MKKMTKEDCEKAIQNLVDIQCTDGSWDNSPYMLGMANGLLIALSVMTGKTPEFKDPPEVWGSDLRELDKFNKGSIVVANKNTDNTNETD